MNKARLEAITDGIIAIAATIMVLELKIPSTNDWSGLMELGYTFFAYVSSFFIIYIAWLMHHDLFKKAKNISRRTFIVNGIWIFFLTLVPFTTAWVGTASNATLPEALYPINMLLWGIAFQWLDRRIRKDNPEISSSWSTKPLFRFLIYGSYILCIILAFVKPEFSMYIMGTVSLITFIWTFLRK